MYKLLVFVVVALFTNGAIGQGQTQQNEVNQFPSQNTAPTSAPTTDTTTMSPAVRQCMNTCPVTSEYNPVCGTDRVTYTNPGRLNCAQLCGVSVSLLRTSPCPPPAPVDPT